MKEKDLKISEANDVESNDIDDIDLDEDEELDLTNVKRKIYDESEDIIDESEFSKKELKKRKKLIKQKKKFFFKEDIKYRGPLSYRYLRIFAWIAVAVTQVIILNNVSVLPEKIINENVEVYVLGFIASLSVPLFIIATISTIINRSKSIKSILIFYGAAYLALAISIVFLYYRYVNNLLIKLGTSAENVQKLNDELGNKLEVNVFADLLAMAIFYFFTMYSPKKHLLGKKRFTYRFLALVPIIFGIVSYVVKSLSNLGICQLPFAVKPFLATKSPMIYVLFIVIVYWLKLREKKYLKLGGTKEQYKVFEQTNRNSLSFAIFLSVLCLILSVVDSILYLLPFMLQDSELYFYMSAFGIGENSGLFIAIPIILLFSYTRRHKNSSIDIIIILGGVGIVALTYIEMIYEIVIRLAANAAA